MRDRYTDPHAHYWHVADRLEWTLRPPSRRLRKLYRELDDVDLALEAARTARYVPEHAPSDYQARRRALADLADVRETIIKRIALVQNDDELV